MDRLRADPEFHAELRISRDTGVPRSVLNGRRVARRLIPQDDGTTLVEPEPEWLPEDLEGLLALQAFEDDLCDGCGHPKSESMHPDNERSYTGAPLQCHACRAARRSVDGWKTEELHGIYLSARKDD